MRTIIIGIVLIAVLAALRLTLFSGNDTQQSGNQSGNKIALPVTAFVTSGTEFSESIYATGTILANESVELLPESAGKVTSIRFNEGDKVSKGQLLVKLNDAELQASLRKAQAMLELNRSKLSRLDDLIKIQGVSVEERDQVKQLVESGEADIAFIRAQIDKTEIKAPFHGIVGLRSISDGAYISTSSPVASILQTDELKLDFSIPEQYANKIKLPFNVEFMVDGSSTKYSAKVYAMNPGLNAKTRSIQLRAKVLNVTNDLFPGGFASVTIPLDKNASAILIPTEAIVPVLKGQQVWLSKNGEAQKVDVKVGYRSDAMIEVTSGLNAGDTVLTTGIMTLKPGTPLKFIAIKSLKDSQAKP
jgi:membrane fusion protein, multidrug efflux system